MSTVKIKLRNNKLNKRGEGPLVLQIIHDRRSTELSLHRYIEPKHWDATNEKIGGSHPSKSSLNIYLKNERRRCEGIIDDWLAQKKKFSLADIVNEYKGKGSTTMSVVEFLRNHINENPDGLLPITLGNYRSTLTRLVEYNEKLAFEDLSPKFLEQFEKYLKSQGNLTNTVHSRMKVLRKIMRVAEREGVISRDADPFNHYKLKTEPTRRRYLSIEELKALENYYDDRYQAILDCFLFACYTGLRFSDLCLLDHDNIEVTENTVRLTLQMSKTKEVVSLVLPNKPMKILEKYGYPKQGNLLPILKDNPSDLTKVALTRRISSMNAYFNKMIKEIAKKAEIESQPSFHHARHTFATLSLSLGVPIEVVGKLLGHTDLKTTQIYAKIIDKAKDDAMRLWNTI